jgi:hypothetical protein
VGSETDPTDVGVVGNAKNANCEGGVNRGS